VLLLQVVLLVCGTVPGRCCAPESVALAGASCEGAEAALSFAALTLVRGVAHAPAAKAAVDATPQGTLRISPAARRAVTPPGQPFRVAPACTRAAAPPRAPPYVPSS
jgi:hypothetical protein